MRFVESASATAEIRPPCDTIPSVGAALAQGLRLGLTLVHRDLAIQGGWLDFECSPVDGTRATVTIPNRVAREEAA